MVPQDREEHLLFLQRAQTLCSWEGVRISFCKRALLALQSALKGVQQSLIRSHKTECQKHALGPCWGFPETHSSKETCSAIVVSERAGPGSFFGCFVSVAWGLHGLCVRTKPRMRMPLRRRQRVWHHYRPDKFSHQPMYSKDFLLCWGVTHPEGPWSSNAQQQKQRGFPMSRVGAGEQLDPAGEQLDPFESIFFWWRYTRTHLIFRPSMLLFLCFSLSPPYVLTCPAMLLGQGSSSPSGQRVPGPQTSEGTAPAQIQHHSREVSQHHSREVSSLSLMLHVLVRHRLCSGCAPKLAQLMLCSDFYLKAHLQILVSMPLTNSFQAEGFWEEVWSWGRRCCSGKLWQQQPLLIWLWRHRTCTPACCPQPRSAKGPDLQCSSVCVSASLCLSLCFFPVLLLPLNATRQHAGDWWGTVLRHALVPDLLESVRAFPVGMRHSLRLAEGVALWAKQSQTSEIHREWYSPKHKASSQQAHCLWMPFGWTIGSSGPSGAVWMGSPSVSSMDATSQLGLLSLQQTLKRLPALPSKVHVMQAVQGRHSGAP